MKNTVVRMVIMFLTGGLLLVSGCSSETAGPNRPPVAVAGPDRAVELGESVTLSGVDSYDPDGSQLTSYTWTLVAAPGAAVLSTGTGVTTELTPDAAGIWVVRLVVSDGKLDSEPDVVQVRAGGCVCTTDAECDDGAYCTGVERCVDCACISENVPDCSDGDVCTQDVCNEDLDRCENPPVTEPPGTEGPVGDATCSDGEDNDCDGMTDGVDTGCVVCSTDAECNDQNECTDDSCSGGACVNAPVNDGTACDDGLWCTDDGSGGGDVCQNGWCVGQQARDCAGAGDQCNDFACDEQADACVAVPLADGTTCDDTLWCTENDECTGGVCGGTQRDCSGSAGECEVGVCNDDLDQCEVQPVGDGGLCDDGEYCTVGETCLSGNCQGGGPRDCTEVADECNDEACDDTADACVAIPKTDGTECGTRSCNLLEWTRQTCVAGACTGSDTVQNCDDGRECTTDACDAAAGCTNTALADGEECGTRYCDGLEHKRQTCLAGVCSGSETLANCDDTNECTTDTCDGAGGCGNAAVTDGTECGSRYCSSLEWRRETCSAGQCSGNALEQNCDDGNVCTDDSCDAAAGCTNTNNTDNCDDSDACTMNDVCANGSCAGVPLDADGDNHIDENCPSGDDCDDSRANVHPGMFEGSYGDAICSDGLDNDCDTLTDDADDTCQECTTDADCDDNNVCNGAETCVGVACQAGTSLTCNDGIYCNGLETCDPVTGCQTASNPCPETECNHCNETDDNCFDPVGTACTDDTLYCTGVEECNGAGSCESSGNPCLPETECNHCNESADSCFDPAGTACSDDGDHCSGVEECNGAGACVSSGNPCLPETECNHCNEATDSCFDPAGTACTDDTLYCTGVEECDGSGSCNSSGNPCPGTECNTCQEGSDSCFDPSGTSCGSSSDTACTDPDTCDGSGTCLDNHESSGTGCDDGTYCNGEDTCDGAGVCDNHAGDPCIGGAECNNFCNEGALNCYNATGTSCGSPTDDDCTNPDTCDGSGTCLDNHESSGFPCNDGQYCTATDTCDGAGACVGSGTPCAAGETCIEASDSCVACLNSGDCGPCEWCNAGSCEFQAAGNDIKGDCPLVECYTGDCDGFGSCEYEGAGTACGDGSDSDCDHPDECDGAGTCDPNYEASGVGCDDTLYCTATDICDGAGFCQGSGDPCLPTETCDEVGDTCVSLVCAGDGDCPMGDLCWPACSSRPDGCVTPPGSLTLTCQDPVDLSATAVSNCTITLAGGDNLGQADCLTCTAEVGVVLVDASDFDDGAGSCYSSGWTFASGNVCTDHADDCLLSGGDRNCCSDPDHYCDDTTFGQPVIRADDRGCDEQVRMTKTFDLSGLTDLWVCFDIADDGATGNESVQLYVDGSANPTPGSPQQVFCLDGEPQSDVNDFFYNYCANLPAWVEDQSDITLMFAIHSNDDDDVMFLDNIVLRGWGGGCTPDVVTALDEDFNTPSECDTTGWTFSNSDWVCPSFSCSNESGWYPGIEADQDAFDMETSVDASELDGEVTVCFQLGYDDTTGADQLILDYDAGSGWTEVWRRTGDMGPNDQCRLICVNLSDIDPAVNNNPALGIRFQFDSSVGEIVVYGVIVTGARHCLAGPAVVSISSPPTGDGAGNYDFTATDTYGEQLDADIICEWDPDTGLNDLDKVHYKNQLGRFIKRRRLTFDNSGRGENLQNFPVLVVLDNGWFDYTQVRSAGEDLLFVDDDDSTVLAHEIEHWNKNGTSYIWVKVPEIDAWDDTDYIWMYYGNKDAPDRQRPAEVWTQGYVAVWHLNEAATDEQTSATHYDSTSNDNDGTQNNSEDAGGFIAGGQYFDGSNDWIEVPGAGLQITGDEMTIEAWARPTGEPHDYCHVAGAGSDGRYWQLWWDSNWNGWHGRLRVDGDSGGMFTSDGDWDTWNYLALLYDGGERRLYWDASEIAWESVTGNLDATGSVFRIGDTPNLSPREFRGYIDEVRISDIYRSDDWLDAQHWSMRDWLITFGPEENL